MWNYLRIFSIFFLNHDSLNKSFFFFFFWVEFPLVLPNLGLDMYNALRELNGEQEIVEMCPQRDFFFQ